MILDIAVMILMNVARANDVEQERIAREFGHHDD